MNENRQLDKQKESPSISIHGLSHDGRGVGLLDNKTTFVAGALPMETVTYRITQKKSNYNEAQTLSVLSPSANRITPPCAHFGVCGGCSLQHMDAAMQITLKQQTLLDQLKHFGQVIPERVLDPLNAGFTGYRRKARLGAKYVIKKEKMLVGFREKSSRYLADLEGCAVLYPAIGEHFAELKAVIHSLEIYQHIPQVEVAIGDSDIALVFRHLQPMAESDKNKLIAFGQTHRMHIYLQPSGADSVHKIWPNDNYERLTYTLPDHELEFLFHPLDFTQINLEMNRLMVNQAMKLLAISEEDHVLDLFCGIGNFTLPIARKAAQVTGIEGSDEMVLRATQNAQHNQIKNASFYAANLMKPEVNLPWLKNHYDKILLDPPRAGAKEILPFINAMKAKKIVYVSCNPATLARDAHELVHQYGYSLKQAGIMNMFPHTAHIEAMALFEKI